MYKNVQVVVVVVECGPNLFKQKQRKLLLFLHLCQKNLCFIYIIFFWTKAVWIYFTAGFELF